MTAIRRKVRSSSLPFRNARRTSIAPTAEKSLPKRRRKLPVLPCFHQEQFMQIRAQISDKSATQIDDQITDLSNCAFQVIPKEQKKQHVVDQMLDAKVKKHTRKQAIVFSASISGAYAAPQSIICLELSVPPVSVTARNTRILHTTMTRLMLFLTSSTYGPRYLRSDRNCFSFVLPLHHFLICAIFLL